MAGTKSVSIGVAFDPRANSLNAIRLLLATLVIVAHSWPLGGYGADPGIGDQDLGDWAVAGFFAISGYLITMSRLSLSSLKDYFWRRFLRIYPAFLVAMLIVAFVFAPISVILLNSGDYSWVAGASYVINNLGLLVRQAGVPGTLESVPFPEAWNGPLWTLFYEFLCYIAIGVLASVVPRTKFPTVVAVAFVLCTLGTCFYLFTGADLPQIAIRIARLGAFFCAGALIFLHKDRIPFNKALLGVSVVLVLATMATGTFQAFAGLPVAYLMIGLAILLPLRKVGASNDISYGMYIYAFPTQQLLALAFPNQVLPVWMFVALAIVLTIPLAWASWLWVEKPAMKLKRLTAVASTREPSVSGSSSLAMGWAVAGVAVSGALTVIVLFQPVLAAGLITTAVLIWTWTWRIERFFAAQFGLAILVLMTVPILRLSQTENAFRMVVPTVLLVTSVAVAARVKIVPPAALVGITSVFFATGLVSTFLVHDDNEWLFYGLEVLVAGSAIIFATAAAKLNLWPVVAKVIILASAAEGALAIYEVLHLSGPIWRGGRILPDGNSTWMRNELITSLPRAQGTFGHPLPLAFMLVVGAILLLRTRGFTKSARVALFTVLAAGVFVSGSRNAILLFVAASVLTLALPALLKRLPVFVMLGAAALLAVSPFLAEQFDKIVNTGSVYHRVGALDSVAGLVGQRGTAAALIGDGSASTPRLYAEGLLQSDGLAAVDNQYVFTLAQNGLVGLVILVALLVLAFRRAPATLRILLLAVITTGMIFDLIAWPVIGFTFWFVIASAFVKMPKTDPIKGEAQGTTAKTDFMTGRSLQPLK